MSEIPTAEELTRRLIEIGPVDTHYHVGPELFPRRYDVKGLVDDAREWAMTLVLKNHTYPTTPLASLARGRYGASFLGSVVLNRFVGGMNPDAVFGAVSGNHSHPTERGEEPPVIVWMPTVHARSHLDTLGQAFDQRWWGQCAHGDKVERGEQPVDAFDANGKPLPETIDVLQAIAQTGSLLATGHLQASEIMKLVPLALEQGVRTVILTHPHYPSVRLEDKQLQELVSDQRVFIEHCFAIHTIEEVPLKQFAAAIEATGPEQVMLSTDFGQVHSDPTPEGTLKFACAMAPLLLKFLSLEQLVNMFGPTQRRALHLEKAG